jgi:hypothetical protein
MDTQYGYFCPTLQKSQVHKVKREESLENRQGTEEGCCELGEVGARYDMVPQHHQACPALLKHWSKALERKVRSLCRG